MTAAIDGNGKWIAVGGSDMFAGPFASALIGSPD